jgi:acyl-coenzyme A synthetase/AMP-(fatty) acid ligase
VDRVTRRTITSPRRVWGAGGAPLGLLGEAAAERHGAVPVWLDRPMAIAPQLGTEIDYEAFAGVVQEASGWLAAAGARAGDVVAIVKEHNFDVIALAQAAARIGAVPALIAPSFDRETTAALLRRLGRPLVVADRQALHVQGLGAAPDTGVICVDGQPDGTLALDALRGAPIPAPRPRREEEIVAVTHTSGTTGVPKLIAHTSRSLAGHAAIQVLLGRALLGRTDVVATCLTTAHARMLSALPALAAVGAPHLAMVDPDTSSAAGLLARHRPTLLETFPNVFVRWEPLADDPRRPLGNVRIFLSTFDAAHPSTIRRLLTASRRRMPLYVQAYAQSEVGAIAVGVRARPRAARGDARDVGWPALALARVRIVDPRTGRRARRGRPGRIEAHGPGVFAGYVGEPDRTAAHRHGGWWDTGDVGVVTRTRQVRLLGRRVDQVPGIDDHLALEDLLLDRLPELVEIIIVPADHAAPVPVVCTRDETPLDVSRWERATADLPPLAPPRQWAWRDLPTTATWKVRRPALRALLDKAARRPQEPDRRAA